MTAELSNDVVLRLWTDRYRIRAFRQRWSVPLSISSEFIPDSEPQERTQPTPSQVHRVRYGTDQENENISRLKPRDSPPRSKLEPTRTISSSPLLHHLPPISLIFLEWSCKIS